MLTPEKEEGKKVMDKKFGFVLLPTISTEKQLITLNQKYPTSLIKLDKTVVLPHCTLLQASFEYNFNYTPIMETIRNYPAFKHPPKTQIGETTVDGKYVLVKIINSSWLKLLNKTIIEEVKDFIVKPQLAELQFHSEAKKRSFLTTGHKYNLDAYNPHFTVAYNEENNLEDIISDLIGTTIQFQRLAYCEHGDYGTIKKVIEIINLPYHWDS